MKQTERGAVKLPEGKERYKNEAMGVADVAVFE